eukprot:7063006-Pyramimonas_sp.AAC.1
MLTKVVDFAERSTDKFGFCRRSRPASVREPRLGAGIIASVVAVAPQPLPSPPLPSAREPKLCQKI